MAAMGWSKLQDYGRRLRTKPSLEPELPLGESTGSRSPGHPWLGLVVLVCQGVVWTLAPWNAVASHHPPQGEGAGGREASFCASEETASMVAAVVVQLALGLAGVFGGICPPAGVKQARDMQPFWSGRKN